MALNESCWREFLWNGFYLSIIIVLVLKLKKTNLLNKCLTDFYHLHLRMKMVAVTLREELIHLLEQHPYLRLERYEVLVRQQYRP